MNDSTWSPTTSPTAKRWQKVFKTIKGYGHWLQLSVFQCRLTARRRFEMTERLEAAIKPSGDHVVILDLGPAGQVEPRVESLGKSSLIPYGNEPERLRVSHRVGDVGIGLSGTQILNRRAVRGNRFESLVVGPVELVGERRESVGEAVGNASALSTGLSTRPAGLAPVRRTRPQIHTTAPLPWRAEPPDSPRCWSAFMPPSSDGTRLRETVGRGPR